jgi:tetratricopeptide (TPR) repeat protein
MARFRLGLCPTCAILLAACAPHVQDPSPLALLSMRIADLELHLRDDPYRSFAHVLPEGRNVFEVSLWQLERAQRTRPGDPLHWLADDAILEFARSRTLERLHLYREAAEGYQRVAASSSRLAPAAERAARAMDRFAAQARTSFGDAPPEEALAELQGRIEAWTALAQSEPDPIHASLAREEAESWEVSRVEFVARERSGPEAIEACQRLIEHHRDSKLHARHLLRLGDLHTEFAQREVARARAQRAPLAETDYERQLEAALSAYEVASETRNPTLRGEAQGRIQVLLSYHDGVRSHVY